MRTLLVCGAGRRLSRVRRACTATASGGKRARGVGALVKHENWVVHTGTKPARVDKNVCEILKKILVYTFTTGQHSIAKP